ncbi:hypothetical protein BCR42DRAFT_411472 [Absidia repens]|uniref:Periplasmic binding protein n=1 Tax=Absidia repens TaxID=90262 RepID=A0A1X2ILS4_9FUNG|nr:hypothetical protein BCR42DRAFT_411472 [Absidia repens]
MVRGYIFLASALLLGATNVSAQAQNAQTCVSSYDQNTDYFPQKFDTTKDSAQLFTIEYHNNYKVLTDTTASNQKYVLVQCGTPAPPVSNFPNGTEIYQIPITKAAVLSTTVVPYLEMLGVAETTKFISGGDWVTSSCFQKYLTGSNAPAEISVTNTTQSIEQLSQVQVQFGYSPGASDPVSNTSVASAETYENSVLGRSSWIGYYSAFYNLESVGTSALQTMTTNYNNLAKAASGYSNKPVVAWAVYNAPDQFNGNTASWQLMTDGYRKQLTSDAGATIYSGSNTNFTSASDLVNAIKDVDILIDETYIATNLTDVLSNYQITDASKYKFAKAIYREDGILTKSDMINVVNPTAPSSSYKRNWFRNVANNEAIHYVSTDDCNWDETKPRSSLATKFEGSAFSEPSSSAASSISAGVITLMASTLVALALI